MIVYKDQGIDWHPQSDSLGVSPLKWTQLTHPFVSSSCCLVESLRQLTCFIGCFQVTQPPHGGLLHKGSWETERKAEGGQGQRREIQGTVEEQRQAKVQDELWEEGKPGHHWWWQPIWHETLWLWPIRIPYQHLLPLLLWMDTWWWLHQPHMQGTLSMKQPNKAS